MYIYSIPFADRYTYRYLDISVNFYIYLGSLSFIMRNRYDYYCYYIYI